MLKTYENNPSHMNDVDEQLQIKHYKNLNLIKMISKRGFTCLTVH